MMDDDLLVGAKVNWIGDRVRSMADIRPRHIGRVCSFTYFVGLHPDDNYMDVMGTFDGYTGTDLLVSGELYNWGQVADFRIYRKVLA